MRSGRSRCCALFAAAFVTAAAAEPPRPGTFDAIARCRTITEPASRLACFDSTTAALADLISRNKVRVVDSETLRQTRRSLFGYYLPHIPLISSDKADEQINEVDETVAGVREVDSVQIEVRMTDGAVWRTTEAPDWGAPKIGTSVHIRRGVMGAYFMTFERQNPVRAIRVG